MPERGDKASKRQVLRERREAQILDAAGQVFARKGYQRATTKEIASEAGVAAPQAVAQQDTE